EKDLLVSGGKYNPTGNPAIENWPKDVARLKREAGVQKILLSIGGERGTILDFTTIEGMLNDTAGKDLLKENFRLLREAFTTGETCVLDGIDIDCEEYVS